LRRLVWAINGAVLVSWFLSDSIAQWLPLSLTAWVPSILLAVYLAVIWGICPPGRLRLRVDRASGVAILAGAVLVATLYEPALFTPSRFVPLPPESFVSVLLRAVLFAVFVQTFVFNLNTRVDLGRRRSGTLVLPFAFYLLLLLPLGTLEALATAPPPVFIETVVTNLFGGAVMFVILLLLYVKSPLNNLAGIAFYLAAAVTSLLPLFVITNTALELVWEFVGYGLALFVVELLLPTTWVERRLLTPERRAHFTTSGRGTYVVVGTVVAIAVGLLVVVPAALGTPHPYYADATGSMVPQIEPGSLLIVHHVNVDSIAVGEVLVFTAAWAGNITVAHKVIAIHQTASGPEFTTKGIANPSPDPAPCPASAVIGVVAYVVPYLGYLVLYSYLLLLVTVAGVAGYIVYSTWHPHRAKFRVHRGFF
jgi:signal peptidase I